MIDNIYKFLQIVALGTVLIIAGCLIMLPDKFGAHTKSVFEALEKHNLGLEVGPRGPILSYSKPEVQEAFDAQAQLDAVTGNFRCILEQNCTDKTLNEISRLFDLHARQDQSSVGSVGEWLVIFAGSKDFQDGIVDQPMYISDGIKVDRILRDGFFRFVVRYDTLEDAERGLPQIKEITGRDDPYIRKFSIWCDSRKEIKDTKPYYLCEKS